MAAPVRGVSGEAEVNLVAVDDTWQADGANEFSGLAVYEDFDGGVDEGGRGGRECFTRIEGESNWAKASGEDGEEFALGGGASRREWNEITGVGHGGAGEKRGDLRRRHREQVRTHRSFPPP